MAYELKHERYKDTVLERIIAHPEFHRNLLIKKLERSVSKKTVERILQELLDSNVITSYNEKNKKFYHIKKVITDYHEIVKIMEKDVAIHEQYWDHISCISEKFSKVELAHSLSLFIKHLFSLNNNIFMWSTDLPADDFTTVRKRLDILLKNAFKLASKNDVRNLMNQFIGYEQIRTDQVLRGYLKMISGGI